MWSRCRKMSAFATTDGEYHGTLWDADCLSRIGGVVVKEGVLPEAGRDFQGGDDVQRSPTRFETTGKLRPRVSGWPRNRELKISEICCQPDGKALDSLAFAAALSAGVVPSTAMPILLWLSSLPISPVFTAKRSLRWRMSAVLTCKSTI